MGSDAGFLLDLCLHGVVGERQHFAVGKVDQDHLFSIDEPLRDRERPDSILRYGTPGVADDISDPINQESSLDRSCRTPDILLGELRFMKGT